MFQVKLMKQLEGDKQPGHICGTKILTQQDSRDFNINYQMPVEEQGWTQDIYNEIPCEGPRLSSGAVQTKAYRSLSRDKCWENHTACDT